jgi:hypothetical protein
MPPRLRVVPPAPGVAQLWHVPPESSAFDLIESLERQSRILADVLDGLHFEFMHCTPADPRRRYTNIGNEAIDQFRADLSHLLTIIRGA